MQNYLIFFVFSLFIFGNLPNETRADWWDNFVNGLSSKITDGADFIRDKAGPVIREKFDDAKETLQDPETHAQIQTWIKKEALPKLEEKWVQFKSFINEDLAPEVQKVYEAAVEASERQKAINKEHHEKEHDESNEINNKNRHR